MTALETNLKHWAHEHSFERLASPEQSRPWYNTRVGIGLPVSRSHSS
jgi:hypothetical protein